MLKDFLTYIIDYIINICWRIYLTCVFVATLLFAIYSIKNTIKTDTANRFFAICSIKNTIKTDTANRFFAIYSIKNIVHNDTVNRIFAVCSIIMGFTNGSTIYGNKSRAVYRARIGARNVGAVFTQKNGFFDCG